MMIQNKRRYFRSPCDVSLKTSPGIFTLEFRRWHESDRSETVALVFEDYWLKIIAEQLHKVAKIRADEAASMLRALRGDG